MPAETAATPKPCRSPLGEACGPSSLATSMTPRIARQPVIGGMPEIGSSY
jgi:hypothetical protein